MTEWQPIETAPKDGTRIITYTPEWELVSEGHYEKEHEAWFFDYPETLDGLLHPTHWMPLPVAPTTSIEGDK